MKKIAIVLFNLGGPDQLTAVRPFLLNLFSDAAIIRLPFPFRQIIANLIAYRRTGTATEIYKKIGGGSPILAKTKAQALELEKALASVGDVKCFIAMRYWKPFVDETVQLVKEFGPTDIILLPLYPQFSTTTTASSFLSWAGAAKKAGLKAETKSICCYPEEEGFLKTLAESTRSLFDKAKTYGRPRLLFSAHGLPEVIVKQGDPYQFQCERTCEALAKELAIPDLDWVLCYQSRVGPMAWLRPSTEDAITEMGEAKRPIIIVPIAFVSEHSETLYEIDMLYKELATDKGVPYFDRVATVSVSPPFIEGLAKLVKSALQGSQLCISEKGERICPQKFSGCPQKGMPEMKKV